MGFFASSFYAQQTVYFREFVEEKLSKLQKKVIENGTEKLVTGIKLAEICDVDKDVVAARVFADYGAIFLAGNGVLPPNKCFFKNVVEAYTYQARTSSKIAMLGGIEIELQETAMNALLEAEKEAAEKNLRITPMLDSTSAKRTFFDTAQFWNTRFFAALVIWIERGFIPPEDADAARNMTVEEQVKKVMEYEARGLMFGSNLSKSIFYTVAPTGTSQHLAMLAIDVAQYENFEIRNILAKHGWFQTVRSDYPHFTYLGVEERQLPSMGLKYEFVNYQKFWVPNLKPQIADSSKVQNPTVTPLAAILSEPKKFELKEEIIPVKVGDTVTKIVISRTAVAYPLYFNMHDDENTSVEAAKEIIARFGGTLIELQTDGKREIRFSLNNIKYTFDPNRIFTAAGIKKTLENNGAFSTEAQTEIEKLVAKLEKDYLANAKLIITLHNNGNEGYSIKSYEKGGEFEGDAKSIFMNPSSDVDDFFFVTEEKYYKLLSEKNRNVALQDNEKVTDDGSLSVYCGYKKIPYINVESEHGHLREQIKMLDALRETLKSSAVN